MVYRGAETKIVKHESELAEAVADGWQTEPPKPE